MADTQAGFDETFAPDGTLLTKLSVVRNRARDDIELADVRSKVRQVFMNTLPGVVVPAWGRILAGAILAYTAEPRVQPPIAATPRRLDEKGNDV